MDKRWILTHPDDNLASRIAGNLKISKTAALILANRGIKDEAAANRFLTPSLKDLDPPALMHGMERAAHRLADAVERGEQITIFGDYDVDGTTATALLLHFLRDVAADCNYYIPHRLSEGYGLNCAAIDRLSGEGTKVLVTVDNGISAAAEVEHAASLGIDVIVTDHHHIPECIPPALAVINPLLAECAYPFKQLAGVGIAFNLAVALRAELRERGRFSGGNEPNLKNYLDLVALGTIADMVPLLGANRIFVVNGLKELSKGERPGVKALKEVSGNRGVVGVGTVGFQLAPRLNAAGRLSSADAGVKLLMSDDAEEAGGLATLLDNENRQRQEIEKRIFAEAANRVEQEGRGERSSIVLADPGWHPGVIGIVASRLVERYYRPTVLLAVTDGTARGSARSIEGFHLYEGLKRCGEHLLGFGGHKYAAGLSMQAEEIGAFSTAFDDVVRESVSPEDFLPQLRIDSDLNFDEIDDALVEELEGFAPFGLGNPEPVFLTRGAKVVSTRILKEAHLKLSLEQGGRSFDAIAFNRTDDLKPGDDVSLVFSAQFNTWNGRRSIQLSIKDLKPIADPDL